LADGQAPGSIDLVRLARSRSQPPRSPRRWRIARQIEVRSSARPAGHPVGLDRDQARGLIAPTSAPRRWAPRPWCGCCRTMPYASATSARTAAGWSAGPPGRRRSLTAATVAALDAYVAGRAYSAGVPGWRQLTGSLLATAGGRFRQGYFWELVCCLARTAVIGAWEQLSRHCLRHSAITFARDAGASLARRPGLRQPQRPPAPPAGMITPATAGPATPPIGSPPAWRSSIAELPGSAPARQAGPAAGIPATLAGTSRMSP
jgi:hypothetical protein